MDLGERVLALERQLSGIQAELDIANARHAMVAGNVQMRIAQVVNDPQDDDNVFDIIFQDGTFTASAGERTPTWRARQLITQAVCYNLADEKIPQDEFISVFYWGDRWWTHYKPSEETTTEADDMQMVGFDAIHPTVITSQAPTGSLFDYANVNFSTAYLRGAVSGVEWNTDGATVEDHFFRIQPGNYFTHFGGWAYSRCGPSVEKEQRAALGLQRRPEGESEWEDPSTSQLVRFYAPHDETVGNGHRCCFLEVPSVEEYDYMDVRLVVWADAEVTSHIYDEIRLGNAHWYIHKVANASLYN